MSQPTSPASPPDLGERVLGALMGAFVGDALALGPHWYYDLDALRRDYGPWITDYTAPRPERYHAGLRAGQSSQAGWLLERTLSSLVERGGYDEADFCRRIDEELFPLLDGTPLSGPGGYTSQSIREAWRLRVGRGLGWGEIGGYADNTEAAERVLAIAVRHALHPERLARDVGSNTALTQIDPTVMAMTVAYACVLGQLVQGHALDEALSGRLMALVRDGQLPFHTVTADGEASVPRGAEKPRRGVGEFASPDALLTPSNIARAARDPGVRIEPAWKVSLVYGMPCAVYHQFPAAYYLAARFGADFENAVLHAVNGGGQNQARAMLTGALCGAMGGLQAIPERWILGLEHGGPRLELARRLAGQVLAEQPARATAAS
ncbi:ADP-ribosylglycohydrolase family protein [Thiomonas sp. FB-6]|uniref:ADP-ribosylglycohydrolase family protein n=1 Tax=Thiomonas sp. FB-6 TaxID=1158291 RepID=UPI0003A52F2A|nr:ADP-ribosylglycohydrolase family protein [Thiomonas sp. FB-6]